MYQSIVFISYAFTLFYHSGETPSSWKTLCPKPLRETGFRSLEFKQKEQTGAIKYIFLLFNSFHFMITLLNSTSKTIMPERWSLSWHFQFHRDHCSFHTSPLDDRLLYKNILFISRHACFFPFYFWYLRSQLHRLHRQETFRNGRRSVTFKSCTLYIRNKADFNCHPLPALPSPTPSPNK